MWKGAHTDSHGRTGNTSILPSLFNSRHTQSDTTGANAALRLTASNKPFQSPPLKVEETSPCSARSAGCPKSPVFIDGGKKRSAELCRTWQQKLFHYCFHRYRNIQYLRNPFFTSVSVSEENFRLAVFHVILKTIPIPAQQYLLPPARGIRCTCLRWSQPNNYPKKVGIGKCIMKRRGERR